MQLKPRTLKFKVVLYLTIALSAAMLLFTGGVAWFLYQELLGKVSDQVIQVSEVISKSMRFAMLQNQPAYVDRIIHDVANQERIDRVRILSKEGRITHSTYAPEIGRTVDRKAEFLLALPPERAAARATSQERADLDLQRCEWRVAARLYGSHPRAVLLQRRLPPAQKRDVRPRRSRHRLFARRTRPESAHQYTGDRRLFIGVHRSRVAAGRLLRAPSGLSANARPRNRGATALRRQSGSGDPGAQRRRIRQACLDVQCHDRRPAHVARRAAGLGAYARAEGRKAGRRRSCAARKRRPCAARSSPRSGCWPPASPTN